MSQAKELKTDNRKYHYAVGRRKSAIAQVRLYEGGSGIVQINGRDIKDYLPTGILQMSALEPLTVTNMLSEYDVTVVVTGGGVHGQADAIRLGIARGLVLADEGYKATVKKSGFLTRDARVKERKKPGLKRARRAPQWSKR